MSFGRQYYWDCGDTDSMKASDVGASDDWPTMGFNRCWKGKECPLCAKTDLTFVPDRRRTAFFQRWKACVDEREAAAKFAAQGGELMPGETDPRLMYGRGTGVPERAYSLSWEEPRRSQGQYPAGGYPWMAEIPSMEDGGGTVPSQAGIVPSQGESMPYGGGTGAPAASYGLVVEQQRRGYGEGYGNLDAQLSMGYGGATTGQQQTMAAGAEGSYEQEEATTGPVSMRPETRTALEDHIARENNPKYKTGYGKRK